MDVKRALYEFTGRTTSVVAAVESDADLAISNSIGGIVAQTTFLATADITYRRANLEHAAASMSNIMYGVILIMQLLFLSVTPPVTVWGFHPGVLLIPITYIAGLKMVSGAESRPMWRPEKTLEQFRISPKKKIKRKMGNLWSLNSSYQP